MIISIGPEDIGQLMSFFRRGCIINQHAFERSSREIAMEGLSEVTFLLVSIGNSNNSPTELNIVL